MAAKTIHEQRLKRRTQPRGAVGGVLAQLIPGRGGQDGVIPSTPLLWATVSLVEGEALFSVQADATRPFVVNVEDMQVRALGSSYVTAVSLINVLPPASVA